MGHNSRQYSFPTRVRPYFLPGSTLVFDTDCFLQCRKALLVPKQQEVHPNSSGSTNDSRVSRLRMSFNYLMAQNRDNKRALCGTKLPSVLANSASIKQGLRSQWQCIEIVPLEIEALYVAAQFLPNFPHILYNREQKSVYMVARRKLTVNVLSANFKKWRFCHFSRS